MYKAIDLKKCYLGALMYVVVLTDLQVSKVPQVGNEMFVIVGFTNTLGYDLTDVTVRMEGLNLFPLKTKNYR